MFKSDELSNPNSCLNKARDNELLFVLLARDPAAPDTIRHWAHRRISMGKNKYNDPQIVEALGCAELMERERKHSPLDAGHDPKTCWHCLHSEAAQ